MLCCRVIGSSWFDSAFIFLYCLTTTVLQNTWNCGSTWQKIWSFIIAFSIWKLSFCNKVIFFCEMNGIWGQSSDIVTVDMMAAQNTTSWHVQHWRKYQFFYWGSCNWGRAHVNRWEGCGLGTCDSWYGQVVGACEHCTDPAVSMNWGEFFDYLISEESKFRNVISVFWTTVGYWTVVFILENLLRVIYQKNLATCFLWLKWVIHTCVYSQTDVTYMDLESIFCGIELY